MNVLVVDDLEEARHLLRKILEKNRSWSTWRSTPGTRCPTAAA